MLNLLTLYLLMYDLCMHTFSTLFFVYTVVVNAYKQIITVAGVCTTKYAVEYQTHASMEQ